MSEESVSMSLHSCQGFTDSSENSPLICVNLWDFSTLFIVQQVKNTASDVFYNTCVLKFIPRSDGVRWTKRCWLDHLLAVCFSLLCCVSFPVVPCGSAIEWCNKSDRIVSLNRSLFARLCEEVSVYSWLTSAVHFRRLFRFSFRLWGWALIESDQILMQD